MNEAKEEPGEQESVSAEFHDFRDHENPMEKRSRGSWSDWRNRPDWDLDAYGRQARAGR